MTIIINYLDALAGAGKTYALARYAHKLALRGRKVLFVQPTKLLIDATIAKELAPLAPTVPVKAIHQDTVSGSVASAIVNHFKDAKPGGEVLFVTQMSFVRAPYLDRKGDWIVICVNRRGKLTPISGRSASKNDPPVPEVLMARSAACSAADRDGDVGSGDGGEDPARAFRAG